ncbi:methyltransferase domain-containing protein [Candidatus Woesearchaeota archaeon]|nr:methyltransferase domain-containing protein [Candidatus Woesearchaeota archaeon]
MPYSAEDLETRLRLVVKELKEFPTEETLMEVPYWSELLQNIISTFGSLEAAYQRIGKGVIKEHYVPFPSEEQIEATTQILEKPRILIRDEAGSGKTAPVIHAIYALEQLVESGRINTLYVGPTYVISSVEAKLRAYATEPRSYITITSSNRRATIQQLEQGIRDGILDTALVTYDAIFRPLPTSDIDTIARNETEPNGRELADEQLVDRLVGIFSSGKAPFLLIGDEIHHIANPGSRRSQAFRKLALSSDRFIAMTGTPFPDSLDDIYELMSLIDNEDYPTADDARKAYQDNPKLIRMFLHRFGKNPVVRLTDIEGMPKLNGPQFNWFDFSELELDIHNTFLNYREFNSTERFVLLRLTDTDSRLVLPENYAGSYAMRQKLADFFAIHQGLREKILAAESTKYKKLDELVDACIARGEKIVIFSKYREGITEALESRYARYGALRIDGSVDADPHGKRFSDRDIKRLTFQTNPDAKVMIITDALREGQDLHTANNLAFLHMDLSPGRNDQLIGRLWRRGQTRDVNVFVLGTAGTPDYGVYLTDSGKRDGIMLVDYGVELTQNLKSVLERDTPLDRQPFLGVYLQNSHTVVRNMSGFMIGRGPQSNRAFLDFGENARLYAMNYNHQWVYSYSAHTARLIKLLVNEIESEGSSLERIIDLGSGPATVSRVLHKPTYCVDMNKYQIEFGRKECQKLGFDIETQVGYTENLEGIASQQFDLAVLSLALHYGNTEKGDRKKTLLEAHRVIKPNGYLVLTLPANIVQGDGVKMLEEGLDKLGFDVIRMRTGQVFAPDSEDYQVYVAVCRRREANNNPELYNNTQYNDLFALNPEFGYSEKPKKRNGGCNGPAINPYRREILDRFKFVNSGHELQGDNSQLPAPAAPAESVKPSSKPVSIIDLLRSTLGNPKNGK